MIRFIRCIYQKTWQYLLSIFQFCIYYYQLSYNNFNTHIILCPKINKTKTYFHQHIIFKELKFVVIDMYVTPLTKMPRWSIWTKSTLLKCGTILVYYRLSLLHTCLHSIWRMINEMHILKNICVQIPKGIDL